jgi:hypothetical protein
MTALKKIETAIQQLSKNEVLQLVQWLDNYLDDEWDKQIETDLAEGKLDQLIAKAEADINAKKVKNIDEVLYNS